MATATLLLPERARFGAQRLSEESGKWFGRADRSVVEGGQLARVFDILPRGWPVAAATRQRDVGDAPLSAWLRADPAYVRPDINGARLLAHGDALSLTAEDRDALLPPLRPLFGDVGFLIDAPTPSRWYVRLPREARLPVFSSPSDALGADLFEHLPDGSEGRRWRALLSEAQVVLHNHPRNAERIARGLPPINSLWFWGAGVLPDHVRTSFTAVASSDEALQAFAALAGVESRPLPRQWQAGEGDRVFDLRHVHDLAAFQADWFAPLRQDLAAGRIDKAILDFADGTRFEFRAPQRWRFWRRPLRSLVA
ncbi:MAG TPA: phosphoglycerate mutase [Lysobacter sp.]